MKPWECVETVETEHDYCAPAPGFCRPCSICGEVVAIKIHLQRDPEFSSLGQARKQNLVLNLFQCLNDFLTEEPNVENYDGSTSWNFCDGCTKYLTEWRESMDKIRDLIGRTSIIKWTLVAKILIQYSKNRRCHGDSVVTDSATSGPSKLTRLIDRLINQFLANVVLGNVESDHSGRTKADEKDLNDSDDQPVDSEGVNGNVLEDDVTHVPDFKIPEVNCELVELNYEEPPPKSATVETKKKRKKAKGVKDQFPLVQVNTSTWLYAETHKFTCKNNKFQCEQCHIKIAPPRHNILRHIRRVHIGIKEPRKDKESLKLKAVEGSENSYELPYRGEKYLVTWIDYLNQYRCSLCQHLADREEDSINHLKLRHVFTPKEQSYVLPEEKTQACDEGFLYKGKYPIRYDLKEKVYLCGVCSLEKGELPLLLHHVRQVHHIEEAVATTFQCRGIPYTFDPSSRNFVCSVCSEVIKRRDSMKVHIRSYHLEPGPHVCDRCGDSFQNKRQFDEHVKRHGNAKFMCEQCGKSWRDVQGFRAHMAVHEQGEEAKKFICEQCGKRFMFNKHLVNHVRTHTGEKPFQCADCGQRFVNSGTASHHRKTAHGHVPKRYVLN